MQQRDAGRGQRGHADVGVERQLVGKGDGRLAVEQRDVQVLRERVGICTN